MFFLLTPLGWSMVIAWALIFIITLIVELETSDLVTIWFCLGSLIALILATLSIKPLMQVIVFVLVSFILILITMPLTKKMMTRDVVKTNSDKVIGMIGVVTQEIKPDEIGEVKVNNSLWRAINNNGLSFNVGEKVIIDGITGIKLVVSKLEGSTNIEIL